MARIMIVDDEENILNSLSRSLKRIPDWEIELYSNPQKALQRAEVTPFDLFMSDYRMPQMSGVELLVQIKALQPDSVRMILSGYSDIDALISAINEAEIYRFVSKPWQDYELIATITRALEHQGVRAENRRLADLVRLQNIELGKRKLAIDQFSIEHPGLVDVNWEADGSIVLDDSEFQR